MESRYRGFSPQMQHNQIYRTPYASSSSNYTNFSDLQALEGALWSGRSVRGIQGESEILRELEKKRIREEILTDEYLIEREMRGMQTAGGFPSSFMLGRPDNYHNRFQPQILHGQAYASADRTATPLLKEYGGSGRHSGELTNLMDRRTALPFQEDYGGSGCQPGEIVSLDVVPLQRGPNIKEIITSLPKAGKTGIVGMGTTNLLSGTKRKQPPSSPPAAGSTELSKCSKKNLNEWSCALCEVSATSERGLHEHLAGKKHQAKEAGLTADHNRKTEKLVIKNSPKSVKLNSNEGEKPEGESSGHKFKLWCKMCRAGFSDKKEMNLHKKGITHLKNQLNRAQKYQGKARRRNARV